MDTLKVKDSRKMNNTGYEHGLEKCDVWRVFVVWIAESNFISGFECPRLDNGGKGANLHCKNAALSSDIPEKNLCRILGKIAFTVGIDDRPWGRREKVVLIMVDGRMELNAHEFHRGNVWVVKYNPRFTSFQ